MLLIKNSGHRMYPVVVNEVKVVKCEAFIFLRFITFSRMINRMKVEAYR